MPSKFTEKEMRDLFGCDHQGMYEVRDMYVVQFLATPGPGGGQRLKYFFERNTKLINKNIQETSSFKRGCLDLSTPKKTQ